GRVVASGPFSQVCRLPAYLDFVSSLADSPDSSVTLQEEVLDRDGSEQTKMKKGNLLELPDKVDPRLQTTPIANGRESKLQLATHNSRPVSLEICSQSVLDPDDLSPVPLGPSTAPQEDN